MRDYWTTAGKSKMLKLAMTHVDAYEQGGLPIGMMWSQDF